eukprot:bmy_20848T0
MYLVSATHPVSPAPTRSSVLQPCLFPMPQAPCTYLMPPTLFLISLYTLWVPTTHPVPSQAVCPLMPTCAVSTERVRWLLEICGHSGAQGTP